MSVGARLQQAKVDSDTQLQRFRVELERLTTYEKLSRLLAAQGCLQLNLGEHDAAVVAPAIKHWQAHADAELDEASQVAAKSIIASNENLRCALALWRFVIRADNSDASPRSPERLTARLIDELAVPANRKRKLSLIYFVMRFCTAANEPEGRSQVSMSTFCVVDSHKPLPVL